MLTVDAILEKLTSPILIERIKSGELEPILDEKEVQLALKMFEGIQFEHEFNDEVGIVLNSISSEKDEKNTAYLLYKDTSGLVVPFHHESDYVVDPAIHEEAAKASRILAEVLNNSKADNLTYEEFEAELLEKLKELNIDDDVKHDLIKQLFDVTQRIKQEEQEKLSRVEKGKMYENFSFD